MTGHIHAKLMMLYAQDAMETDKPWERWETKELNNCYSQLENHPHWYKDHEYRRKTKTININGFEVPEPLRIAPEVNTIYYLVDLYDEEIDTYHWNNDGNDLRWLSLGLIHLTKEAIQLHKDALLSFTKPKE